MDLYEEAIASSVKQVYIFFHRIPPQAEKAQYNITKEYINGVCQAFLHEEALARLLAAEFYVQRKRFCLACDYLKEGLSDYLIQCNTENMTRS